MKNAITIIIVVWLVLNAAAQNSLVNTLNSPYAKLTSVGINDVQWTKGFWAERFAVCRKVMVPQLWKTYTSNDDSKIFSKQIFSYIFVYFRIFIIFK